MDLCIKDKAFLVVGGTAGMGLAAATALARDGAAVAVAGRDDARAEKAAAVVAEAGAAAAHPIVGDVAVEGGAAAVVAAAVDRLGGLDGIAVTTGVIGHEHFDVPDARWIEVFRDVLLGTTRVVEAALPHLLERRGTIVTTSAYSIRSPEIARLPYATMKSAVATFTKGIAKTYGSRGVRANCVAPGAIETDSLAATRARISEQEGVPFDQALEWAMTEVWGLRVAMGRPGRPEEVGALMAFLLSPVAGYLNGVIVNIDGGTDF
ncbi:MAG: SDR family oxidoreductase [Ilumatobacteraceae bacterium]